MHSYKNNDKMYHEQYLFSASFTMNEFFLFSNAFITNKFRATVACFTSFVGAVFALAMFSCLAFLQTAYDMSGLV